MKVLICVILCLVLQVVVAQNWPTTVNCTEVAAQGAFTPYTIRNKNGISITVIPFGGTVTHFMVPDRQNITRDIVLGFDDPTQYCANAQHPYFGAIIGRYANRIANGSFDLDNTTYHTPLNDNDWDTLHGGWIGYDRRVWTIVQNNSNSISLSLLSPNGEMGFPGNLHINATYMITDDNQWIIQYAATTDQDTIINLSQHTYWNLNGFANNEQDILGHVLTIDANTYAVVDSHLIPFGVLGNVSEAYWLDFLKPKLVGEDIKRGTVTPQGGYDNAWVLNENGLQNRAMQVYSPLTGISMSLYTTQVSVQFYSGNFLDGTLPRKADQVYGSPPQYYQHWSALVFEAQAIPDSIHHPQWPTTILHPSETYRQTSIYQINIF